MVTNRLVAALGWMLLASPAKADVVYSNVDNRLGTVHTLIPAGAADGPELGNRVVLAGFDRTLRRIDVLVHIGDSGVAQFDGRVRLYANDGPQGAPGIVLWDSGARRLLIDSGFDLLYSFTPPHMRIPDTLTWTIQLTGRSGQNMSIMGLPHCDPPTIGSAAPGYWSRTPGGWELIAGEPPFGAVVWADNTCYADFDCDGDVGTDHDIEVFFACLAGSCLPGCDSDADFDGDGEIIDNDIEAFFRVLAGGPC